MKLRGSEEIVCAERKECAAVSGRDVLLNAMRILKCNATMFLDCSFLLSRSQLELNQSSKAGSYEVVAKRI
jgi:hypothetical protein